MFYSETLLSAVDQYTTSQIALRNCSKEIRVKPGCSVQLLSRVQLFATLWIAAIHKFAQIHVH